MQDMVALLAPELVARLVSLDLYILWAEANCWAGEHHLKSNIRQL